MTRYIHNDGTIVNSFNEAVDYWRENLFDNDFEEYEEDSQSTSNKSK